MTQPKATSRPSLSVRDAATSLNLRQGDVSRLCMVGLLSGVKKKRRYRIFKDSIEQLQITHSPRKIRALVESICNEIEGAKHLSISKFLFKRIMRLRLVRRFPLGRSRLVWKKDLDHIRQDSRVIAIIGEAPSDWPTTGQLADKWGISLQGVHRWLGNAVSLKYAHSNQSKKALKLRPNAAPRLRFVRARRGIRSVCPTDVSAVEAYRKKELPKRGKIPAGALSLAQAATLVDRGADTVERWMIRLDFPSHLLNMRRIAFRAEVLEWRSENMTRIDGRWELNVEPPEKGLIPTEEVAEFFGRAPGYDVLLRARFPHLRVVKAKGRVWMVLEELRKVRQLYYRRRGTRYELGPPTQKGWISAKLAFARYFVQKDELTYFHYAHKLKRKRVTRHFLYLRAQLERILARYQWDGERRLVPETGVSLRSLVRKFEDDRRSARH